MMAIPDPRGLTDQQCVELWRRIAHGQMGRVPRSEPFGSKAEEAEIIAQWREIAAYECEMGA
jgi:hypothetical protein